MDHALSPSVVPFFPAMSATHGTRSVPDEQNAHATSQTSRSIVLALSGRLQSRTSAC